jgi:hypothetical protein
VVVVTVCVTVTVETDSDTTVTVVVTVVTLLVESVAVVCELEETELVDDVEVAVVEDTRGLVDRTKFP